MKNQFFGDVLDYFKYGLIRRLHEHSGLSTAVCWMMTDNDDRNDGNKTKYLRKPTEWRPFDPEIWDFFCDTVQGDGVRDTRAAEKRGKGILPGATFFSDPLPVVPGERETYFAKFLHGKAAGQDLVLFDPDNGLAPDGAGRGPTDAIKYLYLDEAARAYGAGHSLLIFQIAPMGETLDVALERKAECLIDETGAEVVYSFRMARVGTAFLLVPHPEHADRLAAAVGLIQEEGLIEVARFHRV